MRVAYSNYLKLKTSRTQLSVCVRFAWKPIRSARQQWRKARSCGWVLRRSRGANNSDGMGWPVCRGAGSDRTTACRGVKRRVKWVSERERRVCLGTSAQLDSTTRLDSTLKAPRIYVERRATEARAKRNTRFKEQEERPGRSLLRANKRRAARACSTWFTLPAVASPRRHCALPCPVLLLLLVRSAVWFMSTRLLLLLLVVYCTVQYILQYCALEFVCTKMNSYASQHRIRALDARKLYCIGCSYPLHS